MTNNNIYKYINAIFNTIDFDLNDFFKEPVLESKM